MALDETQKAKVRLYLGWQDRFHQTDSRLEQAFSALAFRAETTALVVAELAKCEAIDEAISAAAGRMKARKVGSIETMGPEETGLLRSRGRQAAGRIASLLGVEVRHDAFSGSAPSAQGSVSRRSNILLMG